MNTSKFATIHGGLLARKGQASPAIASAFPDAAYVDASPQEMKSSTGNQRRDIELQSGQPLIATKKTDEMNAQSLASEAEAAFPQAQKKFAAPVKKISSSCTPLAATDKKRKYRVTVRITAEQKRRMRTTAALLDKPNQQIVSDALDAYLDRLAVSKLKDCACLARKLG